MATATARTSRPATVSLVLTIDGQCYRVAPIRPDFAGRAYRLTKLGGPTYDVAQDGPVLSCDCPDAAYRERQCKHLSALLALGLIDLPGRDLP